MTNLLYSVGTGMLFVLGYLAPGIIASARRHESAPTIWVLTLYLGWTAIGWVIAMSLALGNPKKRPPQWMLKRIANMKRNVKKPVKKALAKVGLSRRSK